MFRKRVFQDKKETKNNVGMYLFLKCKQNKKMKYSYIIFTSFDIFLTQLVMYKASFCFIYFNFVLDTSTVVSGIIQLEREFSDDLSDPMTSEYRQLKMEMESQVFCQLFVLICYHCRAIEILVRNLHHARILLR